MNLIESVANVILSIFIVFGSGLSYAPQFWEIKRTKNPHGFSTLICLILLVACGLRVAFWFYAQYKWELMGQAVFIIFAQLALLRLVITMRGESLKPSSSDSIQLADDPSHSIFKLGSFWRWIEFKSYFLVTCAFYTFLAILVYTDKHVLQCDALGDALGILAMSIEATLGLPQVYQNFVNKSTQGLSLTLIGIWFVSDVSKVGYFVWVEAPWVFSACGITQSIVDMIILGQFWWYNNDMDILIGLPGDDSMNDLEGGQVSPSKRNAFMQQRASLSNTSLLE